MSDKHRIIDSLNDKLATLMETAALVNSKHNLETVVARAVQSACRLTGAETGSLLLLDAAGELHFEIVLGQQNDSLKSLRIPKGQGIAGSVAESGTATIISDVQNDERFFRVADDTTRFVTRSMIVVPLHVKGKVIGVLQAINKQEGAFDHADLKLAIALANLVAPAIEEDRVK
ncbi:MAG: GAF domain-containing protein [Geobacteraceae bacterium]|nr:GAF domain-containing protein [Geobacteraceae bacterium]